MTIYQNDNKYAKSNVEYNNGHIVAYNKQHPNTRMQHSRAMVADDCMQAKKFIKQLGKGADPGALETIQEQLAALGNVGQINNTEAYVRRIHLSSLASHLCATNRCMK